MRITRLMQNRYDDEATLAEVVEERVRKPAKKYTAERAIGLMKGQRMSLSQNDRLINGGNEIITEIG